MAVSGPRTCRRHIPAGSLVQLDDEPVTDRFQSPFPVSRSDLVQKPAPICDRRRHEAHDCIPSLEPALLQEKMRTETSVRDGWPRQKAGWEGHGVPPLPPRSGSSRISAPFPVILPSSAVAAVEELEHFGDLVHAGWLDALFGAPGVEFRFDLARVRPAVGDEEDVADDRQMVSSSARYASVATRIASGGVSRDHGPR